jgi:hypothetical protein
VAVWAAMVTPAGSAQGDERVVQGGEGSGCNGLWVSISEGAIQYIAV